MESAPLLTCDAYLSPTNLHPPIIQSSTSQPFPSSLPTREYHLYLRLQAKLHTKGFPPFSLIHKHASPGFKYISKLPQVFSEIIRKPSCGVPGFSLGKLTLTVLVGRRRLSTATGPHISLELGTHFSIRHDLVLADKTRQDSIYLLQVTQHRTTSASNVPHRPNVPHGPNVSPKSPNVRSAANPMKVLDQSSILNLRGCCGVGNALCSCQ